MLAATFPLRYFYWGTSVPHFFALLGHLSGVAPAQIGLMVVSVVIMTLCGLAGEFVTAFSGGWWAIFMVSMLLWAWLTRVLVLMLRGAARKCVDLRNQRIMRLVLPGVVVLWVLFPAMYAIATAGWLSPAAEQVAWPLVDNLTKIVVAAGILVVEGDISRAELSFETDLRIRVLEAEKSAAEASNDAKRHFMR